MSLHPFHFIELPPERSQQKPRRTGAEMVLVEGAELFDKGRPRSAFIRALKKGLDFSRMLIELPGHWVGGTCLYDIHDLKKFLIREFGSDANLPISCPTM